MSSILQVNNNILREAKYTLKIINGEAAEVYLGGPVEFTSNFSLNEHGYWGKFLTETPSITLPLKNISSFIKTQSIWFRNKQLYDYMDIELDFDYNTNIIEFLNRGIKNENLDFDSLEQLVFLVQVTFVNSVGYLSKKNIFVGRPELTTYSTDKLAIRINQLDNILKDTTFETSVLSSNSDSFYNFISLSTAFKAIYNNPHYKNDDYVYPVVPFVVNGSTYLPNTGITYKETEGIPLNSEIYAEDSITNSIDGEIQQFGYLKLEPECFIATTKKVDMTVTDVSYTSSWNMYTNTDDISTILNENVRNAYNNTFRMFRPIKTFISDREITNMKVCVVSANVTDETSPYLNLITANTSEYKISVDDEIVVCEQMMDFAMKYHEGNYYASRIILFNDLSNIYYYNKSQDIFYWNPIVTGARSLPFPKQWYDMESYLDTGALLRYDINYQFVEDYSDAFSTYGNGYRHITFSNNNFSLWQYDAVNHVRRDNNCSTTKGVPVIATAVNPFNLPAWNPSDDGISTQRYIGTDRVAMEAALDSLLSKTTLKTVRVTDDLDILWSYDIDYSGKHYSYNTNYTKTTLKKDVFNLSNGILDNEDYNTYRHDDIGYTLDYELSINFGENQVMLSLNEDGWVDSGGYTLIQYGRPINSGYIYSNPYITSIMNNFSIFEDFVYVATNVTVGGGLESPSIIEKCVIVNPINPELGTEEFKVYDGSFVICDINISLNQMIINDGGDMKLVDIDTLSSVYQTNLSSNINWLLSRDRNDMFFTDTLNNDVFHYINGEINEAVRLLGFSGTRLNAAVGLANSYLKNMYSDNNGVKFIGKSEADPIVLNDSIISSMNFKTYDYNKIEYSKYYKTTTKFEQYDNDEADTRDQDDQSFNESVTTNFSSNIDVDITITIKRTNSGLDIIANNGFVTGLEFSFTPSNYSSFDIVFNGHTDDNGEGIDDLIVHVTFYDTELSNGEVFTGTINRRDLTPSSVKDEIAGIDNKKVWSDSKNIGFKFPFLYNKYSTLFNTEIMDYWIYENRMRKLIVGTVVIDDLIFFNVNYSVFNLGEQRIIIDSDSMYLNGFGLFNGSLRPFNNNKASFYVEKVSYNFKNKQTKFSLVSI